MYRKHVSAEQWVVVGREVKTKKSSVVVDNVVVPSCVSCADGDDDDDDDDAAGRSDGRQTFTVTSRWRDCCWMSTSRSVLSWTQRHMLVDCQRRRHVHVHVDVDVLLWRGMPDARRLLFRLPRRLSTYVAYCHSAPALSVDRPSNNTLL